MRKNIHLALFAALALLLPSCQGSHFITDVEYRTQVMEDAAQRFQMNPQLQQFYDAPEGITLAEREALDFLYAYMPLADLTDYPTEYYLENIRSSFQTQKEMGWDVPELLFRHFVLPIRVNNENLDSSRVVFYRELKPRVQGLSMEDAILEVNHWCHEKLTYQPSDGRTLSPLSSARSTLGRCGEESTFTVAALRSVGIPARQVYTPRWAHTDDNHAWVEAWANGKWYFMGACEPEPVLNLGWFNSAASRGMLMHTKAFGRYNGPEEKVMEGPNFTEINLTANYAETALADFLVVDEAGNPVDSARVDFKIYNYAEFYSALSKYTDASGRTFLSAGKGDMLAWASKNGKYGYSKVSFGKDTLVTIALTDEHPFDQQQLTIVPPPEKANLPEVTPEQRAENDRRFAQEDSIRKAYMATFQNPETAAKFMTDHGLPAEDSRLLVMSAGNHPVIEEFLTQHPDSRAIELLKSLSHKDLKDVTLNILNDSYDAASAILCPRVGNEFLSPYKGYFSSVLSDAQKASLSVPSNLVNWVADSIEIDGDPKAWRIPMLPEGVWKARLADPRSRDVFFVALARTLGIDARKDPVTGKIQYRDASDAGWIDVDFDASEQVQAPTGKLVLTYSPNRTIDNPNYYTHFTISKIDNGRTQLLTFDEGQVDMGGGVTWANVFKNGTSLDVGTYILCSGNRVSDGSVPVTMQLFEINEGQTTTLDLVIREDTSKVSIMGSFDSESKYIPAAKDWSLSTEPKTILSQTGRGYFVLGFLSVGSEPTNHVLKDLAAEKDALEKWGRPMILLCKDEKELNMLKEQIAENRFGTLPGTVSFGIDPDGKLFDQARSNMKLKTSSKPVILIADTFNRVFFLSQGYTIGIGTQLKTTISKL
jgi:hypothetical protein